MYRKKKNQSRVAIYFSTLWIPDDEFFESKHVVLNTEKKTNNTPGRVFLYEYLKGLFFFYYSRRHRRRLYIRPIRYTIRLLYRVGYFPVSASFGWTVQTVRPPSSIFFFTPRKPTLSFAVYFTLGDTLSLSRHRVARRYIYYSGIVNSKLLQIGFGGYTLWREDKFWGPLTHLCANRLRNE